MDIKVKCYKIKIKPGINRAKSGFIPLGELSIIILLAPCVARKINLSSSPRGIKHHFIAWLINSYYVQPSHNLLTPWLGIKVSSWNVFGCSFNEKIINIAFIKSDLYPVFTNLFTNSSVEYCELRGNYCNWEVVLITPRF